jgi:uncharacterized protein YndB with AHSA1/START domain
MQPAYDWTQYTLKIRIAASPAKLYKAWTDSRAISDWFTWKADIEPRKNGRLYLEWQSGDKWEGKVIKVVKNRQFVFTFGDDGEEVKVRMLKDDRGCICELSQYNMKTSPKAKVSMHLSTKTGWTFFLANLKAYLEHGVDLRSTNIKYSWRKDFING